MERCDSCGKRIWFWQERVKYTIHLGEGNEKVFYSHSRDSCIALAKEEK